MRSFEFYAPTRVIFGKDRLNRLAECVRENGGSRVQIVYGRQSVERSGLLERVELALHQGGIAYARFGGAQPNPTLEHAMEGVAQARAFEADLILAVGGGSAIDTAKAIAHGLANPGVEIWDIWLKRAPLTRSTPVGVVLTIPAAGSEMSDSAVLTRQADQKKRGLNTEFNRVRFALMDPSLAMTLPPYQMSCGIADIMMHTLERYITHTEDCETTSALAEALLRQVVKSGLALHGDPADEHAMSELMWCGSLSHNQLTGLGAVGDWATHKLGHELSGRFGVAHGASLTAVWGDWARAAMAAGGTPFARLGQRVFGLQETGEETADAKAGIEAAVAFFRQIGMPTCFTELGVGVQQERVLFELADSATNGDSIQLGGYAKLNRAAVQGIYSKANC